MQRGCGLAWKSPALPPSLCAAAAQNVALSGQYAPTASVGDDQ